MFVRSEERFFGIVVELSYFWTVQRVSEMMTLRKKGLLTLCLMAGLQLCAMAQETKEVQETYIQGVPFSVYYLMPAFSQGSIYISGQAPLQGKVNICAIDNTLHYFDNAGKEMIAGSDVDITRVRIGDVLFLRSNGIYFRTYPYAGDLGVAVRRDVLVNDFKQGAFNTVIQSSSAKEFGTLYSDGATNDINTAAEHPYKMSETIYLYRGPLVLLLTKRNLKKILPDKKAEIDAFFKSGKSLPTTVEGTMELLSGWDAK